jgi:hypothetical protein
LAAALVELNSLEEAKAALQEGLALDRDFTISGLSASATPISPASLEGRNRFNNALRIAGMPEG